MSDNSNEAPKMGVSDVKIAPLFSQALIYKLATEANIPLDSINTIHLKKAEAIVLGTPLDSAERKSRIDALIKIIKNAK